MRSANLTHTYLSGADISGADLENATLKRTRARGVIVDAITRIWHCDVDEKTDFTGTPLGNIRIDPKIRNIFESNSQSIHDRWWYGEVESPEVKASGPRLFISHTWRSGQKINVLELADRLRSNGIDCRVDIYNFESLHGFVPPLPNSEDDRDV